MHICECSWPIKSGNKQRQIQQQKGEKEKKELVGKKLFIKAACRAQHPRPQPLAVRRPPLSLLSLAPAHCVPGILAQSEVSTAVATVVVAVVVAAFGLVLYEAPVTVA